MTTRPQADQLVQLIRDVPDYPVPGVMFKDITPLLADPAGFAALIAGLSEPFQTGRRSDTESDSAPGVDVVVGIEARGFVLAAPVALALGVGFVPIRKRGKLPWTTIGGSYALEYGTAEIEIHADAVVAGQRVLLIDDVLATGGTAAAAIELIERLGADVIAFSVLMELSFLGGRERLGATPLKALVTI